MHPISSIAGWTRIRGRIVLAATPAIAAFVALSPAAPVLAADPALAHRLAGSVTITDASQPIRDSDRVTLWDEIVPPTPRPTPQDASRAVQGAKG